MKKTTLFSILFSLIAIASMGQAKKPTIMVVPSDAWCNTNGYMMEYDDMGRKELFPDYTKALQSDPNLLVAISSLGQMMAERGFPLKDLEQVLKSIRSESAETAVATSGDGDSVAESPSDRLNRVAKADIIMQLTYTVNTIGPKRSLTFNLQGFDAYTNKQIAGATGTGTQTFSVEMAKLVQEAVVSHIDGFNSQLQTYFDDLFANGREITLLCQRWSGSEVSFETEFEGDELGFQIEDWLATNTVNGRFSTSDASENRMFFEQVRIPMVSASGRALDARTWANDLRKFLRDKYQVESKLTIKGLGKAILTIGAK